MDYFRTTCEGCKQRFFIIDRCSGCHKDFCMSCKSLHKERKPMKVCADCGYVFHSSCTGDIWDFTHECEECEEPHPICSNCKHYHLYRKHVKPLLLKILGQQEEQKQVSPLGVVVERDVYGGKFDTTP